MCWQKLLYWNKLSNKEKEEVAWAVLQRIYMTIMVFIYPFFFVNFSDMGNIYGIIWVCHLLLLMCIVGVSPDSAPF